MKPHYWDEAARMLSRRDRVLRRLIRRYPGIHLKRRSDPFTTLARAIVGQQISVKAADSIWRRFVAVVADGRQDGFPCLSPERVATRPIPALRGCGAVAAVALGRDVVFRAHPGSDPCGVLIGTRSVELPRERYCPAVRRLDAGRRARRAGRRRARRRRQDARAQQLRKPRLPG